MPLLGKTLGKKPYDLKFSKTDMTLPWIYMLSIIEASQAYIRTYKGPQEKQLSEQQNNEKT